MNAGTPLEIPIECLHLDQVNPRITEYQKEFKSEDDLVAVLLEHFAVDELVGSILETGFWQYEPMIVMGSHCDYTVLEGNRRLVAIKVLRSQNLRQRYLTADVDQAKLSRALQSTEVINCILVPSRYESWHLLGFKHINGPQRWNSFAKAAYIYELVQHGESIKSIADQLGDRNRTVSRLLRAYSVLDQVEEDGRWSRQNRDKNKFAFSHLMTGLEYKEIGGFIGLLEAPDETSVVVQDLDNAVELMTWLYGDRRNKTAPVVQSQNPDLGNLRRALSTPRGIEELRRTRRLDYAVDASRGDAELLRDAIASARDGLEIAVSKVSGGYTGEEETLRQCVLLTELSENLLVAVRRKRRLAES